MTHPPVPQGWTPPPAPRPRAPLTVILLRITLVTLALAGTTAYLIPTYWVLLLAVPMAYAFGAVDQGEGVPTALIIGWVAAHFVLIGLVPLVLCLFTGAGRRRTRLVINIALGIVTLLGGFAVIRPWNIFGESMGPRAVLFVLLPALAALLLTNLPQTLAHFRRSMAAPVR